MKKEKTLPMENREAPVMEKGKALPMRSRNPVTVTAETADPLTAEGQGWRFC